MAIKIEMLRCFSSVAEHGSLSEAAAALGRTSSAVSMMLKQFEDHIGAPLFETARKSRLTPLGDMIFDEARRELRHFENTISVIEGLSRSELGYVRLAVTPSFATAFLPAITLRFTQAHPRVQIDIRDMDSAAIAIEMKRERADIGIGTLDYIEGLNRSHLFSDDFGVVCPKGHHLAQNWDQLTWADLHDQVFITNGLCHLITDPEFTAVLAASRLMVPNTTSLIGLVKSGVGITVLPRRAVLGPGHDLAFLPLVDANTRHEVHMISQPRQILTPAARVFLDMVDEISPEEWFA